MFQTGNTLNKPPQNNNTYLKRYTTHLTPTLHSLLGWNTTCKCQPCQCSCVGHYWHKDTVRVQGSKAESGVLTSCTHHMVCTTWQHTMQSTSCTHHKHTDNTPCNQLPVDITSTLTTHHAITFLYTPLGVHHLTTHLTATSCRHHKYTDNTPCNQLPVHITWCAPPDNTPDNQLPVHITWCAPPDNTPCNQLPVHTTWCAPPDNTPGSNFLYTSQVHWQHTMQSTSCTHHMVCTTWQHTRQSTSCTHHMLCTTRQHTRQSTSCTHHMVCTTWQHTWHLSFWTRPRWSPKMSMSNDKLYKTNNNNVHLSCAHKFPECSRYILI